MSVATEEVELWWPNGHGGQTLYPLTVWVEDAGLATVHSETKQVAFRTLELVQEPLSRGLSFYFRVNGRPIFMKGSNWIPASVTPRYDESYYLQLLHSAREAHMNMLRVWGGGIYEYDQFYSLADQLGILIWQDFMFACAMYPASSSFLDSVAAEVRYQVWRLYCTVLYCPVLHSTVQVRRLQHHASLALWAANNENEAALRGNWYNTDSRFQVGGVGDQDLCKL